jgi:hypothetical protein
MYVRIYIRTYCDGFAQSIARQQCSKHIPTRATQQYSGRVFYVVCPCNSMSAVFSAWSMLRLYNGNLFAIVNSTDEYRQNTVLFCGI